MRFDSATARGSVLLSAGAGLTGNAVTSTNQSIDVESADATDVGTLTAGRSIFVRSFGGSVQIGSATATGGDLSLVANSDISLTSGSNRRPIYRRIGR